MKDEKRESELQERLVIRRSGYPSVGEIVIGTVTRVLDFGAFASLDEYENKEGMVHISEVASGWIKDIREHVKKGQKVVCKVLSVNPKRGHIDLSIKDVNERQKREKIRQWKNEMSAFKWLEIVGNKLNLSKEEVLKLGKKLLKEYDSVYSAFDEVASEGYEVLAKLVGEEFAKTMAEIARENIKPKKVKVRGYFEIKFLHSDGVERIKRVFQDLKTDEAVSLEVYYIGAPKYRVVVEAEDYKVAENALKKIVTNVSKLVKKLGGESNFVREAI
ncbi:MAG: translation initiation factor IF-2 subunit alpha [Archaeoglobaceae archaeon]|nr:translation initiation factor IF-2 subunit alpha [Archaeoglobaceae archaeon]MDW7989389.1 translation initiation factor IF-2 subunit alpha [Archaeoglobaceae archaeon]